jgi:hypothetical protein
VIIFLLAAYALIYCVNSAVGRVMPGWELAAATSRYVPLMIPAAFAIYLQAATLPTACWAGTGVFLYTLVLAWDTLTLPAPDWKIVRGLHDGRAAWKAAYLATRDEDEADRRAHFEIYPDHGKMNDRLRFLEQHRLNLFNAPAQP